MIRAVLFDLDGTLLGNDMDRFMPAYFDCLQKFVAPHDPSETFLSALLIAVREAIRRPDPRRTVWERFMEAFERETRRSRDFWIPIFERFYGGAFPSLRALTAPRVEARLLVERARRGACASLWRRTRSSRRLPSASVWNGLAWGISPSTGSPRWRICTSPSHGPNITWRWRAIYRWPRRHAG